MKTLPVDFPGLNNVNDIYEKYWKPFGRILTDIERNGIKVDKNQLKVF